MKLRHISYTGAIIFAAVLSPYGGSKTSPSIDRITKIQKLVDNGCVMLDDEHGEELLAINPDTMLIPASIIKILTAQIALDLLGPKFRFATECSLSATNDLTIRGFGDPFLISDELRLLSLHLLNGGITAVNRLHLDDSYFSINPDIPGISKTNNPYDALNGALVVNFNTVYVGKDTLGIIHSAEKETPLTQIAIEKATLLAPGSKERINLSASRQDCLRYTEELIRVIFEEQGLKIGDSITTKTGSGPKVLTYYNSRPLTEVLQGLLKYSNNFIANQIFLTIGAQKKGAPATLEKSRDVFEQYIRSGLGIPECGLVMVEGSGISRDNRVTGRVMLSIMEKFKPNASLLTPKNGHPLKSGTLNGVNNYAGYIKTEKGLRSFVIMLNQKQANRDALLKLLESY